MRLSAAALALLVACSSSEPPPARSSALFVIGRDPADGAIATNVSTALGLLARGTAVDLIAGGRLSQMLGADATEAIQSCGADLPCIGGLAGKVGAAEAIFGRVGALDPSGVRIQFLIIESAGNEIARRVQIDLAARSELLPALHEHFEQITGTGLAADAPSAAEEPDAPIARCIGTEGQVRVRRARSLRWERLGSGMELYIGDAVETAATATAKIDYLSGSSIEVAPASVIVLEETGEDAGGATVEHIAIRAGVVRGRVQEGARRVVVRTPDGERVDLAAAAGSGELAYRVSARKKSRIEVAVSKGTGVLTTAGGTPHILAAGRLQDVVAGALVDETEELPEFPKLSAPGVDATVQGEEEELRVDMLWQEAPRAASYHLQVAADPSFQKLFVDEAAATTTWTFQPPAQGTYYWRVATRNADGREGEFGFARRLYVTPEQSADLLVSPPSGATLVFAPGRPRFVSFSWRAAVPPAPYVLVVTKDEKLEQPPVLSIVTTAQEVMTRQLDDGGYYWGVFVERSSGKRKPIFTRANKLTLQARAP